VALEWPGMFRRQVVPTIPQFHSKLCCLIGFDQKRIEFNTKVTKIMGLLLICTFFAKFHSKSAEIVEIRNLGSQNLSRDLILDPAGFQPQIYNSMV
jgi:hypothetical protein